MKHLQPTLVLSLVLVVLCWCVRSIEPAIAGDRLIFHVPITYKNVHMTKTRVKPIHHRTFQKTDYKVLGYSADKHGPAGLEAMAPMEYLHKHGHAGLEAMMPMEYLHKHGHAGLEAMAPMEYLAKMQILR